MVQVARIAGQLLQDNLQRELADLAFDTDLLVVKRDNTLGINTTTTPRNLTVNGTMRAASGSSDPEVIFGKSSMICSGSRLLINAFSVWKKGKTSFSTIASLIFFEIFS